jgi:cellulose synthase/poly-beta-1,6-N-acetylglucosamine synthase-like glycosyltransferase
MSLIAFIVLGIYTVALSYVTIYCLLQFDLLFRYIRLNRREHEQAEREAAARRARGARRARRKSAALAGAPAVADVYAGEGLALGDDTNEDGAPARYPFVTIQLPIYNEKYVVERLIDSVTQLDYPRDRFEIHVLDDSTDDTLEITRRKVEEYRAKGFQIEQVRRAKRQGFKAGALRDGMAHARGEFIAIFDADFLPRPDFLKQTIPYFADERVGVVQTRWEHINENYSLITRLQALQLNVHFTVEQAGRMEGGYLLQFNGTAGVWRRAAIEDAGGWEADTLTEDLDLSIRAQLRGWKIRYLQQIGTPAELPIEMNSLKSQQFRWMKGGAETARKMLPTVWRSNLNWWKKVQATFHMLASTVFVFVFLTGVSSVPLLLYINELTQWGFDKDVFAYFLIGLLSIVSVYYAANVIAPVHRNSPGKTSLRFFMLFPLFLSMSMALSLHNTVAVIQGYLGRKSPFVRTPKFDIKSEKDSFARKAYVARKLSWTTIGEGLLAVFFVLGAAAGIYLRTYTFFLLHLMLAFGYGAIFYYSVRHLRANR